MAKNNLVKKVQQNIFRHELFPRGASARGGSAFGGKIVVGVSGGPDSVCLLDILHQLKNSYNLNLVVAHINYGLRGKDSKKDEQLVQKLAEKYSLPIEIKNVTCYKLHVTENSLRDIRYKFLEEIRKKHKASAVAVGHNLNDQAETVLARILRGTGLRGLGAIKFSPSPSLPAGKAGLRRASKNNNIIRPLLNIPRKEILAYLRKNKIPYRIDKTNRGLDFTRNRIRNQLLPHLEKNFNPNIQEVLYKLSRSVADDYDFLTEYAKEWLKTSKTLQVSELVNLHPAVRREVLRLALERHNPSLREIESAHIEEITKILQSNKSKRQRMVFLGLKIERIGDRLDISQNI